LTSYETTDEVLFGSRVRPRKGRRSGGGSQLFGEKILSLMEGFKKGATFFGRERVGTNRPQLSAHVRARRFNSGSERECREAKQQHERPRRVNTGGGGGRGVAPHQTSQTVKPKRSGRGSGGGKVGQRKKLLSVRRYFQRRGGKGFQTQSEIPTPGGILLRG